MYAGDDPVNSGDPIGEDCIANYSGISNYTCYSTERYSGDAEEPGAGGDPGPGDWGPVGGGEDGGGAGEVDPPVEGDPEQQIVEGEKDVGGFASSSPWVRLGSVLESYGAKVAAELDLDGVEIDQGTNLARDNTPIPGTYSFFVQHAEGDAMAGAYDLMKSGDSSFVGQRGTLYVTQDPCRFCVSGIGTTARLLRLAELNVEAPEGLFARYDGVTEKLTLVK